MLGRDQLNCENQRQQMIEAERDLELIVMCTVGGGSGGGGDWQGATSAIKKRIGETDAVITKRAKYVVLKVTEQINAMEERMRDTISNAIDRPGQGRRQRRFSSL